MEKTSTSGQVKIKIDGDKVVIDDPRSLAVFKDASKVTITASEYSNWKKAGWKSEKDILEENTKKIEEAKLNNKKV